MIPNRRPAKVDVEVGHAAGHAHKGIQEDLGSGMQRVNANARECGPDALVSAVMPARPGMHKQKERCKGSRTEGLQQFRPSGHNSIYNTEADKIATSLTA